MSVAAEPGAHPSHAVAPRRPRRRWARRLLRDISSVLIIAGLLLGLDAVVTLVWQEPLTAVIAVVRRSHLDTHLLSLRTTPLTSSERHALADLPDERRRIAYLARREQRDARPGQAIGRIVIPRIGLNLDMIQGTDTLSLEKGPGHYPYTALPGEASTVAIAGHRTTYLAPFRHIDALAPGDRIELDMPYGRFTYAVQWHIVVAPTALWVTRKVGYDRLVLSACNPLYSAAQRIIVFARLRAVTPVALAGRGA
jgi:sortase A